MKVALSRLIDALPGLIWTALPDGRAEFVNQRWRDYTGLSSEQAAGHGWLAAIHPEDVNLVLNSWRGFLDSERAGEVEARLRRHDGQYRRFLFRAAPIAESGRIGVASISTSKSACRLRNMQAQPARPSLDKPTALSWMLSG